MVIHKSILIKQSGLYLVEWDPETNQQISQTQITEKIAPYFNYFAEFDEDVTIKNLLEVIGLFTDEVNMIFVSYLNGVDFDLFLQESIIMPTSAPTIDYIELAWKVRMIAASDMLILDVVPNLIGVSEIQGSDSDVVTELEFVRLRDICHFTICEQTALDIPSPRTYQIEIESERRWTLFDILSGFFSEISRYGSPEEKSQMITELNKESKLSFSELMEYIDEIESLKDEIENHKPEDTLDNDDDDE